MLIFLRFKQNLYCSALVLFLMGFASIGASAVAAAGQGSAHATSDLGQEDQDSHEDKNMHGGHDAHKEEAPKGPHRGRLLQADGFEVELAIFEQGVPPQYRAWAMYDGKALAPNDWQLSVELTRLGGKVDVFSFSRSGDFLLGDKVVFEPHSFDVNVSARFQGQAYNWKFPSHEGRLQLSKQMAKKTGVSSDVAGAGSVREISHLYGRIKANPQNSSLVTARFPGLISRVYVAEGEEVKSGQVVAEVEANESLKRYALRAPISGTVVRRFANPGEVAAEEPLLSIVNYDEIRVDLNLFPSDVQRVKPGQVVVMTAGAAEFEGEVDHVSRGSGDKLNASARVVLDNSEARLPLGLMVEAEVVVGSVDAPLVVKNTALQSFRDWTVVFIKVGNTYEIRPLSLGRSDGRVTEVLEGLNPGDHYVTTNSYLLKADLEKSGASHDH